MTDVQDSGREWNTVCDVLSLEETYISAHLVDRDVVSLAGVWLGERVHMEWNESRRVVCYIIYICMYVTIIISLG